VQHNLLVLVSNNLYFVTCKFLNFVQQAPGLENNQLWGRLPMKIQNFPERNKLCVLCMEANLFYKVRQDKIVGIVSATSSGGCVQAVQNSSVLLIKGIFSKWSQPPVYQFSHSSCASEILEMLVKGTVLKLKMIGITVCVLICDMGSNNMEVVRHLGITPATPYFVIENMKVISRVQIKSWAGKALETVNCCAFLKRRLIGAC
jgi:hypothetical protein